jgi:hypothetical protein
VADAAPVRPAATPAPAARSTTPGVQVTDRVLQDAASPSRRAEDLLQALSDRRAAALASRDVTALSGVHAPGSPSLSSDRALVSGLVDSRTRWEGLRLEVAEAVFVSGSPSEAVVRARVDWTAYVLVTAAGTRAERPADVGRQLDFRLVRGDQGWRIGAISAGPAT